MKWKIAFGWILHFKKFLQVKVCKQKVDSVSPLTSVGNIVGKLTVFELQRLRRKFFDRFRKRPF